MSQYDPDQPKKLNTLRKMFMQAALVTAGNPKAIVFFTAIFPQFIDPNSAYLFQSCILLGLCAVIAFGCFMIYAVCGQNVVSLFFKASVGRNLKRIIGGTFIGAGIGLAASNK
jgi:threonine/homoserine/homoserine lactone efflux protein